MYSDRTILFCYVIFWLCNFNVHFNCDVAVLWSSLTFREKRKLPWERKLLEHWLSLLVHRLPERLQLFYYNQQQFPSTHYLTNKKWKFHQQWGFNCNKCFYHLQEDLRPFPRYAINENWTPLTSFGAHDIYCITKLLMFKTKRRNVRAWYLLIWLDVIGASIWGSCQLTLYLSWNS